MIDWCIMQVPANSAQGEEQVGKVTWDGSDWEDHFFDAKTLREGMILLDTI